MSKHSTLTFFSFDAYGDEDLKEEILTIHLGDPSRLGKTPFLHVTELKRRCLGLGKVP